LLLELSNASFGIWSKSLWNSIKRVIENGNIDAVRCLLKLKPIPPLSSKCIDIALKNGQLQIASLFLSNDDIISQEMSNITLLDDQFIFHPPYKEATLLIDICMRCHYGDGITKILSSVINGKKREILRDYIRGRKKRRLYYDE
jgi:hypothetical protein